MRTAGACTAAGARARCSCQSDRAGSDVEVVTEVGAEVGLAAVVVQEVVRVEVVAELQVAEIDVREIDIAQVGVGEVRAERVVAEAEVRVDRLADRLVGSTTALR